MSRNPVRLYCQTADERALWVDHCGERVEHLKSLADGGILELPKPKRTSAIQASQKITVTTTKVVPVDDGDDGDGRSSKRGDDDSSVVTGTSASPSVLTGVTLPQTPDVPPDADLERAKHLEAEQKREQEEQERVIRIQMQHMEKLAKEKEKHLKNLEEAKKNELENPLRFSEMFRFLLFFHFEQLVDEPDPNQQVS